MYLTREEEAMLKGEEGEGVRRCIDFLVKTGEYMGAKNMVPIVFTCLMKTGIWRPEVWEDEILKLGAKYRVRTDLSDGANLPSFGEHAEYSHTGGTMMNSLTGARCNIVGDANAFASAVTGRAPNCGMHLKENRYGNVLVNVKADLGDDILNWEAAGYVISTKLEGDWTKVPVITGLPYDYMNIQLIGRLSTGLQTASGPVHMFHIPKRTPEAPTLEAAFGPKRAEETITVETYEVEDEVNMWTAGEGDIDAVFISGISPTVEDMEKWANAVRGKKVQKGVLAYMPLSSSHEAAGLNQMIKDAGFITSADVFAVRLYGPEFGAGGVYGIHPRVKGKMVRLPIRRLVTNSMFVSNYSTDTECMLRPTELCIEAALTGKTRAWGR